MKREYIETVKYVSYTETYTYHVDKEGIKEEINRLKNEINPYTILAYIYDLFQQYLISEDIESELYVYIDPKNEYNSCSPAEVWWNMEINNNPLIQYCN